ncbi:MAG: hypothetical protein Q9178_008004 [Gyalolechia marmorata]
MAGPSTDPVVYPDLSKLKKQTANFQKNEDETTPAATANYTDEPDEATQLEQFRYLVEHRGQEVVDYVLTLRQHNNDALDLNEELTGLVASHEALQASHEALQASYEAQQEELETVQADLAGARDRAKKLREELAAAKRELAATKGQLQAAQANNDDESIAHSRSTDHHQKIKWPDAPILTDGENPTFKAWS